MNPGAIELQEIQVDNFGQNNSCECWAHNIADQFPIKSIKEQSGDTIIEVGLPQEGYSIETTVIDGEINGKFNIVLNDNIKSIKYDEFKYVSIVNSIYQFFLAPRIVLITILLLYSLFL